MRQYISLAFATIFLQSVLNAQPPVIKPGADALAFLQKHNLTVPGQKLRLHLGCGESHLNGYINIDFPPSEHTVQTKQAADVYADITTLSFPPESIDEIRSHHVFEHFNRQQALALLCNWHQSLKIDGTLVIETPDFETSIHMIAGTTLSYKEKQTVLRHIFGSQEAYWATHYDGW